MARYPKVPIEPGQVFADLTVLEEIAPGPPHNRRVRCVCSCGKEKIAFVTNLRAGRTKSCGCTYVFGAAGRAAVLADRSRRAQIGADGRLCLKCQTRKPWDQFSTTARHSTGKASACKSCNRLARLMTLYGINRRQWQSMRDDQGGGCALCGEPEDLMVDHDHTCCGVTRACKKCIRGLLCDSCNRVLGRIEQKPALAARFADYLERRPLV